MRWLLLWALLLWPAVVSAQASDPPTTLVADRIEVTAEGDLLATGSVEIRSGTSFLRAEELRYNEASDTLILRGPLRLQDGSDSVILASSAELDQDLRDGILRDARIVLDQQLQLAAAALARRGDRYSLAYKVAATSCNVCGTEPPIWEVRARTITLDEKEQQLYLDGAQFRIKGVPVLWIPRLRLPGPGLERATGFLFPGTRTTTQLSTGIKVPYFIRLGDHQDITVEPYISSRTRTLAATYRRAYVRGDLEISGAISRDDIRPDETRSYVDLSYGTALGRGYALDLNLQAVSDDAYLLDYDYSDEDILRSDISLSRTRADTQNFLSFAGIRSLREGDLNSEIPTLAFEARSERRLSLPGLGGNLEVFADLRSQYRYSDDDPADVPVGQIGGRDSTRLTLAALWDRTWITSGGLVFDGLAEVYFDAYDIRQDRAFPDLVTETTPYLGLGVAYPLIRRTERATTTLQPKLQFVLAPEERADVPNEDSTNVEFDEANLFSTSRAPGTDNREISSRLNAGLTWGRSTAGGLETEMTVGRIFRLEDLNGYSRTSGASGTISDWLVTAGLSWPGGARFDTRLNLEEDFSVQKSSTRVSWDRDRLAFSASHLYLVSDPDEDRDDVMNELRLSGNYDIDDTWDTSFGLRYDFGADQARSINAGLSYTNECIRVSLLASRRFTSTSVLEPTTDLTFGVELLGFATGGRGAATRGHACKG